MKNLTFTTTATIRPSLLDTTYSSFCSNLKGVDFKSSKLIINIDPLPEFQTNKIDEVLKVANKYFGNVIYNTPNVANFPLALKWIWSNVDTEYSFNLEDDWILKKTVNIRNLITTLESSKRAIGVSLNAYTFNANKFRFRLSPCILEGNWVRKVYPYLNGKMCPEQQIRKTIPKSLIKPMLNYPPYSSKEGGVKIVTDTGRKWREKRNLHRNDNGTKTGFTTWKKGK